MQISTSRVFLTLLLSLSPKLLFSAALKMSVEPLWAFDKLRLSLSQPSWDAGSRTGSVAASASPGAQQPHSAPINNPESWMGSSSMSLPAQIVLQSPASMNSSCLMKNRPNGHPQKWIFSTQINFFSFQINFFHPFLHHSSQQLPQDFRFS